MNFTATRLAPSPTGALHLGHARTFLITWWLARQAGAKIFMRMEDLDHARAKSDSIQQAYDDLRWLGIDWDSFPFPNLTPCAARHHPVAIRPTDIAANAVVQSRRTDLYEKILQILWDKRLIYPCTCTRADIAATVNAAGGAPHDSDPTLRYPGTCGDAYPDIHAIASLPNATEALRERTGKKVCWRLRVPQGPITFTDAIAGTQSFDVAKDVGDFPITRFIGEAGATGIPAAYQLACVVDDHAMGIDLVIRGDDLLSSTPRQLLLYRALQLQPPRFAHVPLVIGPDGTRIAKRHGESRIAQFRAAGIPPEKITGWAAWRSGQLTNPQEISATEIIPKFDPTKLSGERITLTDSDLLWLTP